MLFSEIQLLPFDMMYNLPDSHQLPWIGIKVSYYASKQKSFILCKFISVHPFLFLFSLQLFSHFIFALNIFLTRLMLFFFHFAGIFMSSLLQLHSFVSEKNRGYFLSCLQWMDFRWCFGWRVNFFKRKHFSWWMVLAARYSALTKISFLGINDSITIFIWPKTLKCQWNFPQKSSSNRSQL